MGVHVLFSFALTPLRFRVAKGLRLACKRAAMRLQKGCFGRLKGLRLACGLRQMILRPRACVKTAWRRWRMQTVPWWMKMHATMGSFP